VAVEEGSGIFIADGQGKERSIQNRLRGGVGVACLVVIGGSFRVSVIGV